jgi:hypothetical protein
MLEKPKLIVITPVKNESWILEKYLTFTSLWADYIIIADQNSTDNSIEIAQKFEKVTVVKNDGEYNEFERTKILLSEARKIEGKKIIFALDADEFLSANYMDSPEWQTVLNATEKTLFNIERVNLTPDFNSYFGGLRMIIALVDDDSSTIEETSKAIIHNIRLPWPKNAEVIHLNDIKILHLDYISEKRVLSKLRWYQCFEKFKFNHSDKYLREKYLFFNKMNDFLKTKNCLNITKNWLQNFKSYKLDFTSYKEPFLWWDEELLKLFDKEGIQKFKNLDINDVDWVKLAKQRNYNNIDNFKIRRRVLEKVINKFRKILNQIELN